MGVQGLGQNPLPPMRLLAHLEAPVRPLTGWRRLRADFGAVYAANGFIGWVFAATAPVAIILAVGTRGGLSEAQLASWLFGVFFVNGIVTILFCALYRQPLAFFWTIPGTVLVGPVTLKYSTRNPANSIIICEEWSGLRQRREPRILATGGKQTA